MMKIKRKAELLILGFLIFAVSLEPVNAFTESQNRKISVFQKEYRDLAQTDYSYQNIFMQKPFFAAPPLVGTNTAGYLQNYHQTYNFVRSLFGLPEIAQNSDDNQRALIGAYDMAAVPKNDGSNVQHGLEGLVKPAYLSNEMWRQGAEATREGNIANIVPNNFSHYAHQQVWDDILGFVVDNNNYDLNSIGHRDWMLSQTLKSYGVGTLYTDPADQNTIISNGQENFALGYHVFYWGHGYDGEIHGNLVEPLTYPAPDVFPLELMRSDNPLKPVNWSIGFNQAVVLDQNNKPQITIKNLNDGATLSVDAKDIHYESQYGGYETVYSFVPRGLRLNPDQVYQIEFSNLKLKKPNNQILNQYSYQVSFFKLQEQDNNSQPDLTNAGRTVYVNYQPNYGVRIYQAPGQSPTDTFAFHGTDWVIIEQARDEQGRLWTKIGKNQWIPNAYLVSFNNGRTPIGTVRYVPGYGINLWHGYGIQKTFSGKRLTDGTKWKVFKKAIVGNTYWFNLGADFWVDGQYMVTAP